MTTTRRLIVIEGPTGVGKTALSIALGLHYGGIPIISADSRGVYRQMKIGTAVASDIDLATLPHHFVHERDIRDVMSAGDFAAEALERLDTIYRSHDTAIVAGGSGLWVDALLRGFDPMPEGDAALRATLSEEPLESLQSMLEGLDPVYYAQVDRQNPQRLIRAIEVCRSSGLKYSDMRQGSITERNFTTIKIALEMPRPELYSNINRRVDLMMQQGLLGEATELYPHRNLSTLRTVGYSELFSYLDHEITLPEAVELIKRNSRRYAKRQLTWLRRDPSRSWFAPTDTAKIIEYIDEHN